MLAFPHEYKDVNKISVSEPRNTRALSHLLRDLELPLITLLDPCVIREEQCVNLAAALLFIYVTGSKAQVESRQCNNMCLAHQVVCMLNSVLNFLETKQFTA